MSKIEKTEIDDMVWIKIRVYCLERGIERRDMTRALFNWFVKSELKNKSPEFIIRFVKDWSK